MKTGKFSQLSVIRSKGKSPHSFESVPLRGSFGGEDEFYFPEDGVKVSRSFWQVLWRRGILILGCTTVVTAGVYLWTMNQTPQYKGSFQMLIDSEGYASSKLPQTPLNSSLEDELQSDKNPKLDYSAQLQILQSPKVMAGILKEIQTRYPDITYDSLFAHKIGENGFGSDALTLKPIQETPIVEVSYRDTEPQKIKFVLETLAKGYLKYSIGDQGERQTYEQQLQRLNEEIPNLEAKIPNLKQEILELQQKYIFIDPKQKSQQLAEQILELQNQKIETQAQLKQQQSNYEMLQKQLGLDPQQALMASSLSQSPQYQAILNKLLEVETTIALESARFKGNTPQIQSLIDQRNQLIPLMQKEAERVLGEDVATVSPQILQFQDPIRLGFIQQLVTTANQISMLEVRSQVLNQAADELNTYAQGFPAVIRRFEDLQQELNTTTTRLKDLSTQRETLQAKVPPQPQPWELLAEPNIPKNRQGELISVWPNVPLNLALGGLVGLVLGVIVAQVAERLNNVFSSTNEVSEKIPLPLLGVIPASDEALMLPGSVSPRIDFSEMSYQSSPFQEAFRSLNANLRFLNPEGSIRACVITSATPADGKSTVAVNLAQGAAAMGQRVLLVDADLRCPRVHTMLGVRNHQGLADVITQELDVETVIVRSPLDENLFILTAGQFCPDPTRLLSSTRMQALLQHLQNSFDLVIYDTAPILGLADANLLAPHTDGLMMVVGLGKTDREALNLALREVTTAGVPVLGLVANGDKRETHYYRSY